MPDSKTIELTEPLPEDAEKQSDSLSLMAKLKALILSQKHNIKNLSVLVFINFLVAGLGFITKVKIANTLGKADFGLFSYGFALAAYGGAIIRFGLDRTLVRDLIHHPEKKGQIVAASVVLRGLLFALVTVALITWKFFSPVTSDLTWGVVLIALGNSMLGLELKAVYDSMGQFNRHAVYNLIQRCLYFSAVWLMIIFAPDNISVFWLGSFLVIAFSFYLLLQYHWAFKKIDFRGVGKSIFGVTLGLAKNNLVIWFSCLGGLSFGIINQIILKFYEGKESLGGYAAAWQIVLISTLFLGQIARIGNPAMARMMKPDISKSARISFLVKYSMVMFFAAFPICLIMVVWPQVVLKLIYKPEYISVAGILRIMGFYMMVFSLGLVASQYVISARMDKHYLCSVLIGCILSLLFCILLIPSMGGIGAALALLISHGITMGLYWVAVFRKIGS